MNARAVYFVAPRTVEVRDEIVAPTGDETFVESELIGISHGTEMLLYHGEMPQGIAADETIGSLSGGTEYPLKYGYSNVGIIDGGERVFAFYPHQDRFSAVSDDLIRLPPDMSPETGVFLPNVETALTITHDLEALPGEVVVVIGGGVVGQLVVQILTTGAWCRVALVDPIDLRREMAERSGVRTFAPEDRALHEWLAEQSGGVGADRAVDVSGSAKGMQLAIDVLGFAGVLVEGSWFGNRQVTLELGSSFHRKRLQVRSTQVSTISPARSGRWTKRRRMNTVVDLLRTMRPERFITHRIPLEEASRAFRLIDETPEAVLQIVLDPRA